MAIIPERFERGRLAYERIGPEHADELASLMREPLVLETLWPWPTPPSPVDLQASLDAKVDHWERHGFGLWLLRERAGGEFVGRGGLQYTDAVGGSAVEAAWAVMPAHWGQGFATELAGVAAEVAFEVMDLTRLIALTLPHNRASRRVMEKSGFAYVREITHAGLPHVLYELRPGTPRSRPGALLASSAHSRQPL